MRRSRVRVGALVLSMRMSTTISLAQAATRPRWTVLCLVALRRLMRGASTLARDARDVERVEPLRGVKIGWAAARYITWT